MDASACIVAYNEHRYLKAHLSQYPEWVGRIVVCESSTPWNGRKAGTDWMMRESVKGLEDPRVSFITKAWPSEHVQRNWGLASVSDGWAVTLDPDEFLTPDGWETLRTAMETLPPQESVIVAGAMRTYWKDADTAWDSEDTHHPVIAVRLSSEGCPFYDKRETVEQCRFHADVLLHHLSWVRSDDEVLAKLANYSHAKDFDTAAWFARVWKGWEPGMRGIKPMCRGDDTGTLTSPLPDSIRKRIWT